MFIANKQKKTSVEKREMNREMTVCVHRLSEKVGEMVKIKILSCAWIIFSLEKGTSELKLIIKK